MFKLTLLRYDVTDSRVHLLVIIDNLFVFLVPVINRAEFMSQLLCIMQNFIIQTTHINYLLTLDVVHGFEVVLVGNIRHE